MTERNPSRFSVSVGSASTASPFSYTPSPPSTSNSQHTPFSSSAYASPSVASRPTSSSSSPTPPLSADDDLRAASPLPPPFLAPLGGEGGEGGGGGEAERLRAVQRRRREEQQRRQKMLDRRTVVDVRKIREERERKLLSQAPGGAKSEEEKRREKERKAGEMMRAAMRREDDKRAAFRFTNVKQQQQLAVAPLTSPKAVFSARSDIEEGEEADDEAYEAAEAKEAKREAREEAAVEESKEQVTSADETTFITATNELQSPTNQPTPGATLAASHTSRSSLSTTASTPPTASSSPRARPKPKGKRAPSAFDGSGLSAYMTFLQQRVRHMLVSNGVFIPVGDGGALLVNTAHNAALATQHAASLTRPPSPPPPQFHLPSLQPPTSHFLPSSASIQLASGDERQLYELLLFLARVPLLQGCALDVFFRLSREVREVRFDEYEVIANEGEEAEHVFLVRDGRIDTKLNLERSATTTPSVSNAAATKPLTPVTPQSSGGGGGGGSSSSLRRRFYSVNTASLDVSCLGTFDLCGESVLLPARRHLTSLISMTASACYSLHAAALLACLPAPTLASLGLYSAYTSSLVQLYIALRARYRSSYHTSVVDFRLFVDGSLRRNLRHANERSRMRKEIERLGGDGGWMRDRQASRQIRHMQLGQRRVVGGGGGGRRGERAGGKGGRFEEEEKEQLVGEVAIGGAGGGHAGAADGMVGGGRRSVTVPQVMLSFTTLNFGDTPQYSTESSPMSSNQSRSLVLPPLFDANANIHPALR